MAKNYKQLQNGSDIRGVAMRLPIGQDDAGRENPEKAPGINLDGETVSVLAQGFVLWLSEETEKPPAELTVAVGRDPRLTGPELEEAICRGMSARGVHVLSAGLASTPAMFMTTVFPEFNCDGAIMITASHMPMDRNGMKFFSGKGGLEKQDISEIISLAESLSEGPENTIASTPGEVESINLMDRYAEHLRKIIIDGLRIESTGAEVHARDVAETSILSGLKITVDAGNGGGGFYATKVLGPLGADITTSQFLEPDGSFPNHIPNPEDKAAMKSICDKVRAEHSDLGLIFDTDVDRASAVDEYGNEISRNGIVALAAALIARDHPGTTVVTDSVTSNELAAFLTGELGLKHLRYKRGYRNVIGKAIELNEQGIDAQLAIETSGHGAYKQNYFLDDGAYLATLIVIEAAKLKRRGQGISSVIARLKDPLESLEFRLPIVLDGASGNDISSIGDQIIQTLTNAASSGKIPECRLAEPNYEGVRIDFNASDIGGWALLRKSLHDPIMPLNIEAMSPGGCKKIISAIKPVLAEFPELDISSLIQYNE